MTERFWRKVPIGDSTACWPWKGAVEGCRGYGRLSKPGRESGFVMAHRMSFELHHGPIPEGLDVLHKCDNRTCVNPSHLFLGTPADNMADMVRKGRSMTGERNHKAKLIREQVAAIRAASDPRKALAKQFGITPEQIGNIKRKQSWA